MTKRFSLKNKLILIFGALIALASSIEGLFAIRIARKAVTEKVEAHLIGKANDTAEIIIGRVNALFQFLQGIARMPVFTDEKSSLSDKIMRLQDEVNFNRILHEAVITDAAGVMYTKTGEKISVQNSDWYRAAISGKTFMSEPQTSLTDGKLIFTFAVPLYDSNNTIVGTVAAGVLAEWLSEQIKDIVVGKTGYCHITDSKGVIVAHKNFDWVKDKFNGAEQGKRDAQYKSYTREVR